MKLYLILVLIISSLNIQAAKASPKKIIFQQNFSTQVEFELPKIDLEQICSSEVCSLENEKLFITLGNSVYQIYEIYITDFHSRITWEEVFQKNISLSIKMKEVTTNVLYNLFLNLTSETPCAIGENNRLSKTRVLCKITERY